MDPTYPLYPIFSFLAFFLVLIPFPWHLQAWNTGTCLYMLWAGITNLNDFINAVVWKDDAINRAPVFCDISVRITIGASVGIPAAAFCIVRRLHQIATIQAVTIGKREKRREILIDLLIGLFVPLVVIVLQYIVEGHRFNIFTELGCQADTYNTIPAFFLVYMWPLAFGVGSAIYCGLTIYTFAQRRAEMSQFLSNNRSITYSRYFRLMALAATEMVLTIPLSIYVIVINTQFGVFPFINEANVHFNFSRVEEIPDFIWKQEGTFATVALVNRWFPVLAGFIFFGFFGFAQEARKNYRTAFWSVARRFGYTQPTTMSSNLMSSASWRSPSKFVPGLSATDSRGTTLPVFVSQRAGMESSKDRKYSKKRDSFLSSIGDLSASFSVDVEEKDYIPSSPSGSNSSSSLPPSPDDELAGLPHLPIVTVTIPSPPPPALTLEPPRHQVDAPTSTPPSVYRDSSNMV